MSIFKKSYHSDKHSDGELLAFKLRIKKACNNRGELAEEDIMAYLQIVDTLQAKPTLSERAVRTILKLIEGKDDQIALNALNLLDYIIKNNNKAVILMNLIACKDFLTRFVKTLPITIRDPHVLHKMAMSSEKNDVQGMSSGLSGLS